MAAEYGRGWAKQTATARWEGKTVRGSGIISKQNLASIDGILPLDADRIYIRVASP